MTANDDCRALLDKSEIEDVLNRYCRACDRVDEALFRSVFHPDATLEYPGFFSGSIEEMAPKATGMRRRFSATLHAISNINITLAGDAADSECYIVSYHVYDVGGDTYHFIGGGRYVDRFERRAGEWRIARRQAYTDWSRHLRVDPSLPQPF